MGKNIVAPAVARRFAWVLLFLGEHRLRREGAQAAALQVATTRP